MTTIIRKCNKKQFTKIEAEKALKRNKKSSKQYRKEVRYYYCGECNSHHLTSKKLVDDEDLLEIELTNIDRWKQLFQNEG